MVQKYLHEIMKSGKFIISLDFELFWGVSEKKTINNYFENLKNTRFVVEKLLNIFLKNDISATWATVGFLFFANKEELISFLNNVKIEYPKYKNQNLNNYLKINNIKNVNNEFYFAPDLIKKIYSCKGQEIATHTFSHFYTLEPGAKTKDFVTDLDLALKIAKKNNIQINSIVFPRNQYSDDILKACKNLNLKSFRGNLNSYIFKPSSNQSAFKRLIRLANSYFNISAPLLNEIDRNSSPLNVPASRFLRPFNPQLSFLENRKIKIIKNEMSYAAKNNKVYHLWWHPHNFGKNISENFKNLDLIISHYKKLNSIYNFKSANMCDILKF